MNYKETKAPVTTVTYDKDIVESQTENIYEAISIISKSIIWGRTDDLEQGLDAHHASQLRNLR